MQNAKCKIQNCNPEKNSMFFSGFLMGNEGRLGSLGSLGSLKNLGRLGPIGIIGAIGKVKGEIRESRDNP